MLVWAERLVGSGESRTVVMHGELGWGLGPAIRTWMITYRAGLAGISENFERVGYNGVDNSTLNEDVGIRVRGRGEARGWRRQSNDARRVVPAGSTGDRSDKDSTPLKFPQLQTNPSTACQHRQFKATIANMMTSTIRSPPSLGDYTPLSEHQEQTPATFHGGKPILYYHAIGAKAWVPRSQRGSLPIFPTDASSAPTAPENITLNGASEEIVEQKIDIFVNSEFVSLPPLDSRR